MGERRAPFQVRLHGRGGQGVVTAAELLSVAAFLDGQCAQAFPSFGSERTGAPVVAFCRIADERIRTRAPVVDPDALIVQDATLLHQVDVFAGLRGDAHVLINSSRPVEELGIEDLRQRSRPERLLTVRATEIALEVTGRPVPNVVMLGGFAAATEAVSLDSVLSAVRRRFAGPLGDANVAAATAAYDAVKRERQELAGVAAD